MIVQTPHPFTLTIVACATEAHHFRWEIRRGSRLVASSKPSFSERKDATLEGHAALRHMIAEWRSKRRTATRSGRTDRERRDEGRLSASAS